MRHFKSILLNYLVKSTLFVTTCVVLAASCNRNDDPKKPTISAVGSGTGEVGDTIIISGEHFNNKAENTTVAFDTANAKIIDGTATSIKVVVPRIQPTTVKVKAVVSGLESNGVDFTVKETVVYPMEFDDFEPKTGKFQTKITISGENFTSDVEVFVNDKPQSPVTVNSEGTEISFQLASQTYSGEVKIKRGTEELVHDESMEYELTYNIIDFGRLGGTDIVVLEDKSYFLTRNFELLKVSADEEVIDTIIKISATNILKSLFLDKNGMLYISDYLGKIYSYSKTTNTLDSIDSKAPELLTSINGITGDNNGNLYVGSNAYFGVIKINIETGVTEQILNTGDDKVTGVTFFQDTIYATSRSGIIKVHKNGGSYTYIVPKEDGYSFRNSGIIMHPSGVLIIADESSDNGGIFQLNDKYELSKKNTDKFGGIYLTDNRKIYIVGSGKSAELKID